MAPQFSEMSPLCCNETYNATEKDRRSDDDITEYSSDSSTPENSFSIVDSVMTRCDDTVYNPFGSFRHSGPLSHSIFDDSSSFSHSPVRNISSIERCSNQHENSTHIYMNMMEESEMFDNEMNIESRTAPDGKEDSLLCSIDETKGTEQSNKRVCSPPTSCRLSSTKRRLLAKQMKQMRKILQNADKKNTCLKLLAVV
jgi:hypothetical protein